MIIELENTWGKAVQVGWAYAWRTLLLLGGVLALGFLWESLFLSLLQTMGVSHFAASAIYFMLALAGCWWIALRWLFKARFPEFRLRLAEQVGKRGERFIEPRWGNLAGPFLGLLWRQLLWLIPIAMIMGLAMGAMMQLLGINAVEQMEQLGILSNVIIITVIAICAFKMSLGRPMGRHRLVLTLLDGEPDNGAP